MLMTKEIMDIIPHRHPFLLVDTIEEMEPGVRAVGKKCVTYDEYYFRGHFPEEPVMPGVLIIEALAQVGAVCVLSCDQFKGKTAYFGGINHCKIKKKVVPGDALRAEEGGLAQQEAGAPEHAGGPSVRVGRGCVHLDL